MPGRVHRSFAWNQNDVHVLQCKSSRDQDLKQLREDSWFFRRSFSLQKKEFMH